MMTPRVWVIEKVEQMTRLTAYLANVKIDCPKQITLSDYSPPRSTQANARLWVLYGEAANQTGHSAAEIHEFALMRFFGAQEIKIGEYVRNIPLKRSSQRNKAEFSDFMESTEAWLASELGVIA